MTKPKDAWTLEAVCSVLEYSSVPHEDPKRLPNGLGWQITTDDGRKVTVYDTGSLVCQGKSIPETKALFVPSRHSHIGKRLPPSISHRASTEDGLVETKTGTTPVLVTDRLIGPCEDDDPPWEPLRT